MKEEASRLDNLIARARETGIIDTARRRGKQIMIVVGGEGYTLSHARAMEFLMALLHISAHHPTSSTRRLRRSLSQGWR